MVFTFNSLSVKEIVSAHKCKPSGYKSCKKAKHALIKTSMPSIMLNYMMTMINIFIFDIFWQLLWWKMIVMIMTMAIVVTLMNANKLIIEYWCSECRTLAEEKICILKFPIEPIQLTWGRWKGKWIDAIHAKWVVKVVFHEISNGTTILYSHRDTLLRPGVISVEIELNTIKTKVTVIKR